MTENLKFKIYDENFFQNFDIYISVWKNQNFDISISVWKNQNFDNSRSIWKNQIFEILIIIQELFEIELFIDNKKLRQLS